MEIKLRDYQEECIRTICQQKPGAHLCQMATGMGKCFAKGTKILMHDGSEKEVQEIKPEDKVMGWDSQPRTVVSCARGKEKMYEIKRKKHDSYIVNESHILSLKITGISNKREKFVIDSLGRKYKSGDICNIEVRDYLKCSKTFKHVAKGFCMPVKFDKKPVPVDPYFLGVWLGDGASAGLRITTEDSEILEEVKEFARNNGFAVTECKYRSSGNAKDYYLKNFKRNSIRKYFKENLFLNKRIPDEYIKNSEEVRLQILAGLIDTDGYLANNSNFEFCSKSERIRDQVSFLCRTLGFTARNFKRYNKKYLKEFYYCIISGDTERVPTRVKRKKAINNSNKNNLMHGIDVVPAENEEEYFGFEISGKDRMFLLSDCTVVHNTATFSQIPRQGRVLLLSHREELVHQPAKYYDCKVGFERAGEVSHGEEVVSASVQSMVRRLDRFSPDEFDMIVTDEAHRAVATTYRRIYDYFRPRLHVGFTATPNRGDHVRLDSVFSKIIFQRDLRWAIEHGYLCDIHCLRVNIGFDLSRVHTRMGDYAPGELEEAMAGTSDAIAQAYREHARGATLIFAVSVSQAEEIAARIPGAVVVTGKTKNRADIIDRFTAGEIPCIVNVMVFTEGTDIPRVETVIIARPTQSEALYCLDEKTEILTENGWKRDVCIGERVAAFVPEIGEIKFVPSIAKVRRPLSDDECFYSIQGQSCDIRVTNKHRMLYRNKQDKFWSIKTAEEVAARTSGAYIPVSGYGKFSGIPLNDDEIRFIAWVVTDGHINPLNNQITISQSSTQPWVEEIQRVIESCGLKFGRHICNSETKFKRNGNNIVWTVSKGKPRGRDSHLKGWAYLETYLSKDFSRALHNMTEKQFEIFIETCHMAGGRKQAGKGWTQRSYHIGKGNKQFLENLQIAAIMRGYRANLSIETKGRDNPFFTLHIKKQDFINVGSSYDGRPAWKIEKGSGEMCWCVQNAVGTLVTRRNGKVAIVGNCQMVGRGLRLYPGKEKLILIDCVGVTGKASLCTAPSLLGIDLDNVPEKKRAELQGDLFELPDKIIAASDCPESWIKNVEIVDLWAREQKFQTHDVNWFRMPDGSFVCSLPERQKLRISCPDALGNAIYNGVRMPMQDALDTAYVDLRQNFGESAYIWDLRAAKKWGKAPASDKQKKIIARRCKGFDVNGLTKMEASQILNRVFAGR